MGGDQAGPEAPQTGKISIHAPRMGGDSPAGIVSASSVISIHAPRMGGDIEKYVARLGLSLFQSTPPAWGATGGVICFKPGDVISIHAPRMGGDCGLPTL